MKNLIVSIALVCLPSICLAADISDSKRLLIDRLLEQTGQSSKDSAALLSKAMVSQMLPAIRHTQPNLEARAYPIIADEIQQIVLDKFLNDSTIAELMYAAYAPRFNKQELEAIIKFYDSNAGKKLIKETPAIMQASMVAGQDIGRTLLPLINERIKARLQLEGIKIEQ
ncbi:DUF2059 domain-containing protein [Neptuniibacter sp. SY11_33]|uniref:DUF2059 domain-containing protein n=1 Tax=Neptuniibacter sp. SY11_33 TaxID=3398215 RepID=UPI0039F5A0DB